MATIVRENESDVDAQNRKLGGVRLAVRAIIFSLSASLLPNFRDPGVPLGSS